MPARTSIDQVIQTIATVELMQAQLAELTDTLQKLTSRVEALEKAKQQPLSS